MTIYEAISVVDRLTPNGFSQDQKVKWLSRMDAMVKRSIIDTHEGWQEVTFDGYDENTDPETVLLVPAPFNSIYPRWLEAQMHYHTGEMARHNNAVTLWQSEWDSFRNDYNGKHLPLGSHLSYF